MDTAPDPSVKRTKNNRRNEGRVRQKLKLAKEAGREHPHRWRERLGETTVSRPDGPLLWIHVPNETAAFPYFALIERLRLERSDLSYLITVSRYGPSDGTLIQIPENCHLQYLPYDDATGVKLMLDHWQPDCCLWGETVLLPKLIQHISTLQIPLFMVDAVLPDEIQNKLRWFPKNTRKMLEKFQHIIAVDGRTARNIRRLGVSADRIEVLGRVEEAAPPLDFVQSDRDELAELLVSRPIWLAVGVSEAEAEVVVNAHKQASHRAHRLILILVPDDISCGEKLAEQLENEGWQVARRAADQEPVPETQIYIADLANELGLWLRLSPIAFLGHSLDPQGDISYDPFQASALGSAVLHGPNLGMFAHAYARLHKVGAAIKIDGEQALTRELEMLLSPAKTAEMARAAWEVSTSGAEVSDRICALVFGALDARRAANANS